MKCMFGWVAGASLALICTIGAAHAQSAHERTARLLREARDALPDNAARTETLARGIITRTGARRPPPHVRRLAIDVLANAVADQNRCGTDLPAAEQATQAPAAGEDAWRFAVSLYTECGDYSRGSALLSELQRRYPESLEGMSASTVYRLASRSSDAALLHSLTSGEGWTPDDPADDISDLRLALIRAHLAHGDQAAATSAAENFIENGRTDLGAIVVLLTERTFEPIASADPSRFQFVSLVNRFAVNAWANYEAHPDRLTVLNALAATLRSLNRSEEALILIDDALARIQSARRSNPPFSDIDEGLNWTYNLRADIYRSLGREEDALRDLATAAELSERGSRNVSQRLNRAGLLLDSGRPEEAIQAAREVNPAHLSPYGRSVRRNIMVCAAAELGRADEVRQGLAEAVEHATDSLAGLQSVALCANDMDIAAQAFIRRLDDLGERRGVILRLQSFAGEPSPADWLAQYPLYQREDVRAAINRSVVMRTFPISRPNF